MDLFLFRILRSLVMAFIMFFSCISLGCHAGPALLAAVLPLILGIIGVAVPAVFSLTALVMGVAVMTHVFPDPFRAIQKVVISEIGKASAANKESESGTLSVDKK
jgi:hypothetical protein